MVWDSYLLKNFPQFAVIHTVKVFSVFNEAEVDFFFFFFWKILKEMGIPDHLTAS